MNGPIVYVVLTLSFSFAMMMLIIWYLASSIRDQKKNEKELIDSHGRLVENNIKLTGYIMLRDREGWETPQNVEHELEHELERD